MSEPNFDLIADMLRAYLIFAKEESPGGPVHLAESIAAQVEALDAWDSGARTTTPAKAAAELRRRADELDPPDGTKLREVTMLRVYMLGDTHLDGNAGLRRMPDGTGPYPMVAVRALGGEGGFGIAFTHPRALDYFRTLLLHAQDETSLPGGSLAN